MAMALERMAALRRRIELSSLAQAGGGADALPAPAVSFGAPELDACFRAGGLEAGSHQAAGQGALPLGFAAAVLARLMASRSRVRALIVQEADAVRESGSLYPPGLRALGVDPGRLLTARGRTAAEALRIADEAAHTSAFATVVLELRRGEALLDLSVTRRFNLAAERTGALILLLTPTLEGTSAALTRWRVEPDPERARTAEARRLLGRPNFHLTLTRNRFGRAPAAFTLEWDLDQREFRPPPPLPAPVVAAPADGDRPPEVAPIGSGGDRPRAATGGGRQGS